MMRLENPSFSVKYLNAVIVYWNKLGISLSYRLQKDEQGNDKPLINKLVMKDGKETFIVYPDGHRIKKGGKYFNPQELQEEDNWDKKVFLILSNKLLHSIESAQVSQNEGCQLTRQFVKEHANERA